MALPSVDKRLTELEDDLDRLLAWGSELPTSRRWVERLNELRFVRGTLAWETFLEESAVCFQRGAPTLSGIAHPLSAPPSPNAQAALQAILGTASYGNWLNETWTLNTTGTLFRTMNPYQVLASPVFTDMRRIRNRIVHRSESAKRDFTSVVVSLYGSRRPGISPGRLLSAAPKGALLIEHYLKVMRAAARTIVA